MTVEADRGVQGRDAPLRHHRSAMDSAAFCSSRRADPLQQAKIVATTSNRAGRSGRRQLPSSARRRVASRPHHRRARRAPVAARLHAPAIWAADRASRSRLASEREARRERGIASWQRTAWSFEGTLGSRLDDVCDHCAITRRSCKMCFLWATVESTTVAGSASLLWNLLAGDRHGKA